MWPFNRIKRLEEDKDQLKNRNSDLSDRIEQLEADLFKYKGIDLKYRVTRMHCEDKEELDEYIKRAEEAASKQSKIDAYESHLGLSAGAQQRAVMFSGARAGGYTLGGLGQSSSITGLRCF